MKRLAIPLACCIALASCGGNLMPIAASFTPAVLSADQITKLQQTCQVAAPLLNVAASPTMPANVAETAVYPKAYCDQLLAGSIPPTTDRNTPTWLPGVIKGVQVAAEVAKVALPIVLPLL